MYADSASATRAGREKSASWRRAIATTPRVGETGSASAGNVDAPRGTRERTAGKVSVREMGGVGGRRKSMGRGWEVKDRENGGRRNEVMVQQ